MSMISDFINDLAGLPEIDGDGDRPAVSINAVIADLSTGEGIAVSCGEGFSTLAYAGQGYELETNIQIDLYSTTYLRMIAMKEAVIQRYHGHPLKLGQTKFYKMQVTFANESASDLNETVFRAIITLQTIT
jgi:hypothetical protein